MVGGGVGLKVSSTQDDYARSSACSASQALVVFLDEIVDSLHEVMTDLNWIVYLAITLSLQAGSQLSFEARTLACLPHC